ncbi:MAG TPA: ferrochelatase, partial [Myxococcota bacterium]|nr:ferrochelatase [Myxococcota bacterium]
MSFAGKTGLLLVNLGTPEQPEPRAVRRYLREFLSDPRVLTMPRVARWLLLNLIILPTRPRRAAQAYRQIWQPEGSPLLIHSRALAQEVAKRLGEDFAVELAMRYGEPSIERGLDALSRAGAARLIVLPLFPQYASAVTASVSEAVFRALARRNDVPPVEVLGPFYDEPDFARSWAALVADDLAAFRADHVLFSYHGLPEDQIRASDPTGGHCLSRADCCDAPGAALPRCYRAQCLATTRALVAALGLD